MESNSLANLKAIGSGLLFRGWMSVLGLDQRTRNGSFRGREADYEQLTNERG
jgi:hypothetical protein